MTEIENICRQLLKNNLKLVEIFCEEAVYATDKEVRDSQILEDDEFPDGFKTVATRYGKKRNFINLVHRELKKLAKEEFLLNEPTMQQVVQLSRLFLKESKKELEDLRLVAELMESPAVLLAIKDFKNLKKQEKELGIDKPATIFEEDREVLRRVQYYIGISEYLPGNKRG